MTAAEPSETIADLRGNIEGRDEGWKDLEQVLDIPKVWVSRIGEGLVGCSFLLGCQTLGGLGLA